jgi:hypothetical protein
MSSLKLLFIQYLKISHFFKFMQHISKTQYIVSNLNHWYNYEFNIIEKLFDYRDLTFQILKTLFSMKQTNIIESNENHEKESYFYLCNHYFQFN